MNSYKIFKYFAIVVGVIAFYFAMRVFVAGDDEISGSASLQSTVVSPFIYVGYILFFLTIGIVVFFSIKNLATSGNAKKTFINMGVIAVIVLISYLFTSGEARTLKDGEIITENVDHWISAGFVILYILVVISIVAMLMTGVNKIKNR